MLVDGFQLARLRSLTVGSSWTRSYHIVVGKLVQSPRLAGYITCITLQFADPSADMNTLQNLFENLVNARQCTIRGTGSGCPWIKAIVPLFPCMLEFPCQRELPELQIMFFSGLSRATLGVLITCAPIVSFYDVGVDRVTESAPDVGGLGTSLSKMEQLLVMGSSVGNAISQPQFAPYRANLRRLGLTPSPQFTRELILSAARTLQHLRLDCTSAVHILSDLPSLPSLHSLDLVMSRTRCISSNCFPPSSPQSQPPSRRSSSRTSATGGHFSPNSTSSSARLMGSSRIALRPRACGGGSSWNWRSRRRDSSWRSQHG
ncbi:hypothetical protein C8R43DRAFT_1233967 [Mycena crocata]|nr:hypothetical protein C8R43DRAFT_1233967 [Mycena crocata]